MLSLIHIYAALIRFHFFPVFIIDRIYIGSKVLKDFTVLQRIRVREYSLIVLKIRIEQIKGSLVRGGVCDVFKILLRDIRAAEEINPFLRILLVWSVSRDYPGIQPEIGSLLGEDVYKRQYRWLSMRRC